MSNPVSAITAGASLIGGLAGSKGSGGGTTTQTNTPWGPQQEYLTYGFGQAKDLYNRAMTNPVYTGQRVADLNPFQIQGANQLGTYANNNFGLANTATTGSANMIGAGSNFGNNAADIYSRYSNYDPTAEIVRNAGIYANNPYVDGMIDASSRDVVRNLGENILPNIDRMASRTGNLNSTRTGVESAIAKRGAADRLADISSEIRSKFFGTGLGMAQNQFNQNLTNSLNSNNQLLSAFNSGMSGVDRAQNLASGYFDQLNTAGGMFSGQDQKILDADMAQFNEQRDIPLNLLGKYMGAVQGNYGGTQSTTAPTVGGGFMGGLTGGLGGFTGALGTLGKLKGTGIFGL